MARRLLLPALACALLALAGCGGGSSPTTTCSEGTACQGTCVDTATDVHNCGSCGNACASGQLCSSGQCTTSCPGSETACPASNPTYCAALATDPKNCGACGKVCSLANATAGCSGGGCTVASCAAGFADCNGDPADGCEVNTANDPNNCGACGHACGSGKVCSGGQCAASCASGETGCPTSNPTYCATLSSDPANCGACGNVCNLPHATAGCASSSCTVASCAAGYANCDGNAANGCETNTASDPNNCGACGNVCNLPHATATCASSSCTVASCAAGYANCNGSSADGCETNTSSDPANCGACGKACQTGQTCSSGTCTGGVSATVTNFLPELNDGSRLVQGWSIGGTLILKDNGGSDLFGFFWNGTSWTLVRSGDSGASWSYVESTSAFGDPALATLSWGLQEIAQDSAGNVHLLSYNGSYSAWHYARVSLTRTSGAISAFSVAVQDIAIPGTFHSPDIRGHVLDVEDASGNERIAICIHDMTSGGAASATHVQVTSGAAGITPSASTDFVTIGGSAVSGTSDVVYTQTPVSYNPVHNYTSLMGQDGSTRDLWVFVGGINTGDDPGLSPIKAVWLKASSTTWTVDTSVPSFGNSGSGSALAVQDCRGTSSGVWLFYEDCSNGLTIDKFAGGTRTRTPNVVPHPDTSANAWAYGNLAVSPDETKVFVGYNLSLDLATYTDTLAYWNGSSWTKYTLTPLGDSWGTLGTGGWPNGLVWGWIDGSTNGNGTNAVRLSAISVP